LGLQVSLGGWLVVRVTTEDGATGWGEATALPDWGGDFARQYGETPQTVAHLISDFLAPALSGVDAGSFAALHLAMDRVVRGHPDAKAAVEMACYDLVGKVLGVPVYRLLGGPVRTRVPVCHMLGLMPVEDALREAEAAASEGVRAFQIKGGQDPSRDEELVRRLRQALGREVWLRLDANQGYRTAKRARRAVAALESAGVDAIEQPAEGLAAMAAVTASTTCTVIADESSWTAADALAVVQACAADAISIYVAKAGGLYRAQQVATVAEAAGLACDINGSIEMGIGNAANLHAAAAFPACTLPCVLPVNAPAGAHPTQVAGSYYEDDLVAEPFEYADGHLVVPDRPGLGITVDEEKLNRYRVKA
jgi:muconate cycloisomerase